MPRPTPTRAVLALAAGLGVVLACAPASALATLAPDAPLPIDPEVLTGRLDNGLTWIVRANGKPEARAELRLVVQAGSVDEDDDQRGLAHFVEHMLFNGTERWAGNEIVEYLESIGSRFGADLNAYTSFDETVYMLTIPTDRDELLPQGVEILAEFAHRALLDPAEIAKERGVVLDEWRRGLGAGKRVRDKQLPVLLQGSRYAERLPIGLPEVIETADEARIRRFYEDWYRPSRMAIVAVGDFDAAAMVERIATTFGSIPADPPARERLDWPVPVSADTLWAIADDPELRGTSVGFSLKHDPPDDEGTWGAYRRDIVRALAMGMLNERLAEVAQSPDPPFLGAFVGGHPLGRTVDLAVASARVSEGGEAVGLAALAREVRRAVEHGFLPSELERVGRDRLAGLEAAWAERGKTPSGAYASEYVRHVLHDEPIPGIDVELALWRQELPAITPADCHRSLTEMFGGEGVVVEVTRPTREAMVGEEALRAALREAAAEPLAAWEDAAVGGDLLAAGRPAGRVVERREHPGLGLTEAVLSNGVRVFLRPTAFQDDDVRFRGLAPGGTSVVDDDRIVSAELASSLVGEAGYGGRSPIELGKLLAGKVVSVRPFFGERDHGVDGSSTVADLPTALELAVLVMTAPNRDEAATARFLESMRARLANREADPSARFMDAVNRVFTQDAPRARPLTLARLEELDPEAAVRFHEEAFANAADFAFFFVGNLDVDAVLPEIARTLGSLPSTGTPRAAWVDRGVRYPDGTVEETVRAGSEPRSQTVLGFRSYDGDDPREWHRIRTATSILERRLRETLREDLGATYGVSVDYGRELLGPDRGRVVVRFGCDPAAADELVAQTKRILDELRTEGPTDDEVAKEKEIQTRELETALEQNGFWLGSLASLWERDRPFDEFLGRRTRIDELDREGLARVFREEILPEPHVRVTWLPDLEEGSET